MSVFSKAFYPRAHLVWVGLSMLTAAAVSCGPSELDAKDVDPSGRPTLSPISKDAARAASEFSPGIASLSFTVAQEAAIESRVDSATLRAIPSAQAFEDRQEQCLADPRVLLKLVSVNVCVGADLFFRDTFAGNGRSCATCHPVANNLTIDPAFIATLPATDPLFVAERNPDLAQLEKPALMRQFGLILENLDGIETPTTKFAMRSVPHTFSMATSVTPEVTPTDGSTKAPNHRTGWSGDGAPDKGELRDFQTGAIRQHYTRTLSRREQNDFRLATAAELDAIGAYLSSIGRSNEIDLVSARLTDSGAERGRTIYIDPASRCNGCHNNAGANITAGGNKNFNTGVELVRLAVLNTGRIPFDGGFGGGGLTNPNSDANRDGIMDSFGNGTFNTPPLIEAADTGPFFHTNAFTTLEEAIAFYNTPAFNLSPAGLAGVAIRLSPDQVASVGRFLRVLNATFNVQLAIQRARAARTIVQNFNLSFNITQNTMLRLAAVELTDALEVMGGVPNLNPEIQTQIRSARAILVDAAIISDPVRRATRITSALNELTAANTNFGSGMNFVMGEGGLMF